MQPPVVWLSEFGSTTHACICEYKYNTTMYGIVLQAHDRAIQQSLDLIYVQVRPVFHVVSITVQSLVWCQAHLWLSLLPQKRAEACLKYPPLKLLSRTNYALPRCKSATKASLCTVCWAMMYFVFGEFVYNSNVPYLAEIPHGLQGTADCTCWTDQHPLSAVVFDKKFQVQCMWRAVARGTSTPANRPAANFDVSVMLAAHVPCRMTLRTSCLVQAVHSRRARC